MSTSTKDLDSKIILWAVATHTAELSKDIGVPQTELVDMIQMPEGDTEKLREIHGLFLRIERVFAEVSAEGKEKLCDMHNETTWLGHLTRWGVQNSEEAFDLFDQAKN